MHIVDSQVHIWGADTPDRPWPPGRAHQARVAGRREDRISGRMVVDRRPRAIAPSRRSTSVAAAS